MSEINDIEEIPEGNFPIILKWIHRYQRAEPSMIAKYKNGTYHKGSFYGVGNADLNFITCEDKIVIPEKLQSYIFHWYHTYFLCPGMDRMEAMIHQHFYWPDIRHAVKTEVRNYDTCQRTKISNKNMVNYQLS